MSHTAENIWEEHWKRSTLRFRDTVKTHFTRNSCGTLRMMLSGTETSLLEAGCGTGRLCFLLAKEFPGAKVAGLDYSASAIERASAAFALPNLAFVRGDLFAMPYADNAWDVVFNEGVIEHFPLGGPRDYVSAVREMARVTRPGGKVIVSVPNSYCFPHALCTYLMRERYAFGYEKSFRPAGLRAVMEGAGLRVTGWRGYSPTKWLADYQPFLPICGHMAGGYERLYTLVRPYAGWLVDRLGDEFYMCAVKDG